MEGHLKLSLLRFLSALDFLDISVWEVDIFNSTYLNYRDFKTQKMKKKIRC